MAPAELQLPEAWPIEGGGSMDNRRILRRALSDEVCRTILRESLNRYRNELMSEDERCLLWDRILRLRRLLGIA